MDKAKHELMAAEINALREAEEAATNHEPQTTNLGMKKLIEKTAITCVTSGVIGICAIAFAFGAGLVAGGLARVFLAGWRLVSQ